VAPHRHRAARSGKLLSDNREAHGYRFGSLLSTGPFPVSPADQWYFPCPMDLLEGDGLAPDFAPSSLAAAGFSNLPSPLRFGVGSMSPPSKSNPPAWISSTAFEAYLRAENGLLDEAFKQDSEIHETESTVGIAMDPESQSQNREGIYSAHYLRLKPGWRLGNAAECLDKGVQGDDLIEKLVGREGEIIAGGQRKVCSVTPVGHSPALPHGCSDGWETAEIDGHEHYLVKWVLLSPAIFPRIEKDASRGIKPHSGGWMPSWIDPSDGSVLLKDRSELPRENGESRPAYRKRLREEGPGVGAKLVAALTGKPVPITGWSLQGQVEDILENNRDRAGSRSLHLAVPAGSVYYFAAASASEAARLASLLNWHGQKDRSSAGFRRSTLAGEKGFGLGVCGTWQRVENQPRRNPTS